MSEDPRCCGTGTCIINEEGICWCGQVWDGEKMCMPNNHNSEDTSQSLSNDSQAIIQRQ